VVNQGGNPAGQLENSHEFPFFPGDQSPGCNVRPGGLEMDSPLKRALDIAARFIERRTGNLGLQG